MTKDEFLKTLLMEGFVCEKNGQYPSVVCDARDVRKTAGKVRSIAKEKGYSSSFAIRSFKEGMELISKDGAVSAASKDNEVTIDEQEQPVTIAEPIPMTALAENESA